MSKHRPQQKRISKPGNRLALILAFIVLVLLLLFVRLVIFVRGVHVRHFP